MPKTKRKGVPTKRRTQKGGLAQRFDLKRRIRATSSCAPDNKSPKVAAQSCFSNQEMMQVKELVNKVNRRPIITANDPTGVYHQMRANYAPLCGNQKERCWLKKAGIKETEYTDLFENFKPEQPDEWKEKPNAWLSNIDIEKVLHDFEWVDRDKKIPSDFKVLGAAPIDFDKKINGKCVTPELCDFDVAKFLTKTTFKRKQKTKIGIVLNTHPHTRGGEHWISVYVDLDNLILMFFDSTGNSPPLQVVHLMQRIETYMRGLENKKNLTLIKPRSQMTHQSKNTECGIYTLFFIVSMLTGKVEFEDVVRPPRQRHEIFSKDFLLKDEYIQQYRDVYFDDDDDDEPIVKK